MKSWIAGLFVMMMLFPVTGLAASATPTPFNGHYYLVGDANCTTVRERSDTSVFCYDRHGVERGYRDALTVAELQGHQLQQTVARQEHAELNEQLRQGNQYIQAMSQSLPSYSTPQVQGIPAQGTTTYNQVGNTLIGTDGTSCQTVGQTTVCR